MSDDIPYNRVFDLEPGRAEEVAPGVRRIVANNPGPFTFKGTVSYIVGSGKVAIIDPGPDDPAHIAALLDAVRGETVTHIFVTHTHRDHSPGVPAIKAATGATVLAEGPHRASRPLHAGEAPRMEASNDTDFRPDRALADGEVVSGDGWTIEAITTPGHTANHMAFALKESDLIFSGDHVMGWSTSIVAPPDGAMSDFMNSLHKLASRPSRSICPATAARCATRRTSSPPTSSTATRAKPRSCTGSPRARPTSRPSCARSISGSIRGSSGAAGYSVLAHLEDMTARGEVATDGPPSISGVYRLAAS